jgi:hypothetical protein
VRTAYDMAAILASALYGIEAHKSATIDEKIYLEAVKARLSYLPALECIAVPRSELSLSSKSKWAFFSALVCVFRNTIQHANPDRSITAEVPPPGRHIVITNVRPDEYVRGETGGKAKEWPGSTREAATYHINRYQGKGFRMEVNPLDESIYNSRIPVPDSF